MIPLRKRLILEYSQQPSIKYFIVHGKTRGILQQVFSALYINFTVWADCVGESEIACLETLITLILLYVSLDQGNQSSS